MSQEESLGERHLEYEMNIHISAAGGRVLGHGYSKKAMSGLCMFLLSKLSR